MRVASLKTHIRVAGVLRSAQSAGAFAYVMQKGDADNGIVLVKVATLDGMARLYSPSRNMAGDAIYQVSASLTEGEIAQTILNRAKHDPDLWIIEIEDKKGRHFLTDPIEPV